MARDPKLLELRNKDIREFHNRMRNLRVDGARKYAAEYCIQLTAEKFRLRPRTIEGIVFASD